MGKHAREATQLPKPLPPLPETLAKKIAALTGAELTEPVSLPPLVTALCALTSNGARPVEGRSRGNGKRSASSDRADDHGGSARRWAPLAIAAGSPEERPQSNAPIMCLAFVTGFTRRASRRRPVVSGQYRLRRLRATASSPNGWSCRIAQPMRCANIGTPWKAFKAPREPFEDFRRAARRRALIRRVASCVSASQRPRHLASICPVTLRATRAPWTMTEDDMADHDFDALLTGREAAALLRLSERHE